MFCSVQKGSTLLKPYRKVPDSVLQLLPRSMISESIYEGLVQDLIIRLRQRVLVYTKVDEGLLVLAIRSTSKTMAGRILTTYLS